MNKELQEKLQILKNKKKELMEEQKIKEEIKKEIKEINEIKNKNTFLGRLFNKEDY